MSERKNVSRANETGLSGRIHLFHVRRMQVLDKGWYLKLIVKENKKTQTKESLISAQTSCNRIDNNVIFQAKFPNIEYVALKEN